MTLGERIQEHRKEAALSQEALGEALGVTRQSISKWESDAAIPELDKLIAMSRLFHTSVGALLGVEEANRLDRELTERELKALSAIAEKLTPPKAEPPRKKRWPRVAAAVAAAALILWGYGFSNRMSNMENQMQNVQYNVNNIDRNVSLQISGIAGQVKDILEEQNKVTADMGYEITDADLAAGTVTFRLWAVPRTHQEGMSAHFTARSDEGGEAYEPAPAPEPVSVQAAEGEGHRYEATLTCPLSDSISLSVTFRSGGESQNQVLGRENQLVTLSRPLLYAGGGLFFADVPVKQGVPTLVLQHLDVNMEAGRHPAGREEILATAATLRLWRGDQVIYSQTVDAGYLTSGYHNYLDPGIELPLEELEVGENIYLSVQVTDSAGRQYEECLDAVTVETGRATTVGGVTTVTEYRLSAQKLGIDRYPWEE